MAVVAAPPSAARLALRRRPRVREAFIQGFLFLCGALSILTTVGIVYELGKESLAFFTSQLWENSNKPLAQALAPHDTVMQVGSEGGALQPEDLIQVHDEVMRVVSVDGLSVAVERGLQGT